MTTFFRVLSSWKCRACTKEGRDLAKEMLNMNSGKTEVSGEANNEGVLHRPCLHHCCSPVFACSFERKMWVFEPPQLSASLRANSVDAADGGRNRNGRIHDWHVGGWIARASKQLVTLNTNPPPPPQPPPNPPPLGSGFGRRLSETGRLPAAFTDPGNSSYPSFSDRRLQCRTSRNARNAPSLLQELL